MQYLVLSDIHGAVTALEQVFALTAKMPIERIIILGDNLNHGARNKLPPGYVPADVVPLLNARADKIMALRGNCDGDVDGMLFNFPCNAPYLYLTLPQLKGKMFLTHGHLHDFKSVDGAAKLGLTVGDVVLSGHTHLPGITRLDNGLINVNPGSVGIPRKQPEGSFGLIDDKELKIVSLSGNVLYRAQFKSGQLVPEL